MNRITLIVILQLTTAALLYGQDEVAAPMASSESRSDLSTLDPTITSPESQPSVNQLLDAAMLRYENLEHNSEDFLRRRREESLRTYELLRKRLEDPELRARIRQVETDAAVDPPSASLDEDVPPQQNLDTDTPSQSAPVTEIAVGNAPASTPLTSSSQLPDPAPRGVQQTNKPVIEMNDAELELHEIRAQLRSALSRLDRYIETYSPQ